MGQQIFYVNTPLNIKVPISIIHFQEKNCIIFPLLAEDYDFEKMLESSADSKTVKDFLDDAIIHLDYEYPTRKLFDFIHEVKLNTFGIIGFSNSWTVPEEASPLLFINGDRVKIHWTNFETKIHEKLEAQISFLELIRDEQKYRSFYDAEDYYFKQIEKNCDYQP